MRDKSFEIVRQYLYDNFDIQDIEYLYYQGVSSGSEFLTYASTKLYLTHELYVSGGTSNNTTVGGCSIYDENNVLSAVLRNQCQAWDTVIPAMKFAVNDVLFTNNYFSRLAVTGYQYIKFNGYKITIP